MGIPDRRGAASPSAAGAEAGPASGSASGSGAASGSASVGGSGALPETQAGPGGVGAAAAASSGASGGSSGAPGAPPGATPWAGTDTNGVGEDRSVPLPATVFAPPLSGSDDEAQPPAAPPDAKTALMSGGSQLPSTAVGPAVHDSNASGAGTPGAPPSGAAGAGAGAAPPPAPAPGGSSYGYPQGPGGAGVPGTPPPGVPSAGSVPPAPPAPAPNGSSYGYPQGAGGGAPQPPAPGAAAPGPSLAPNAGDIADAATSKAEPPMRRARSGGANPPPPPGAPGTPGARPAGTPGAPGPAAGGYVPTQMVSALGPDGPGGPAAGPGAPPAPPAPDAPRAPGPPNPPGAPNPPGTPNPPGAPQPPGAPGAPGGTPPGGVHHAATMLADPSGMGPGAGAPTPPGAPGAPHPPGAPGMPGAAPGAPQHPGAPGAPGAAAPQGSSGGPRGAVHHAETVLSGPPVGAPGTPPPPQAPGAPGAPGMAPGGAPVAPPGAPQPMPPGAMPPPGGMPPGAMPPPPPGAMPPPPPGAMPPPPPGAGQPSYGYPQQGQPTVGPGYQAVLRYRAQDGSEQQLIRRSAPGTPHPEWQIFHELRAMNVPPDQVLELHTELESCELPGAYCARMIREQWPQARLASIAPYGTDHASRQQGMRQLIVHQGELHQVADGPARPAPIRAPLPQVQPAPPIPPEGVAQELAGAFGPGLFRFEQAAVSRQGVPPVVAHSLVVAGLPTDMGPFFWAQAQPGRPVPTLAELAAERGVQPSSDAGSYLVMGSDFGKAICVQYGTANIVAVPVEAGPGGAPVPPQFVNTGLPEFQRCLSLLGRMWRLRFGLNQEQAGRWSVDFQAQLAALDPAALGSPESWWSVLLEQMWDGLL
ncbi:SUKH-4 family immunity protein [Streptomyces sp. NBC_00076]|uniref:SUKH-4 family immunity protein n=1 Tax=Streptomyces sp. NBC_00076 TaxID=2975642 RepID=UPI00324E6467